jgi:hypothetical protein
MSNEPLSDSEQGEASLEAERQRLLRKGRAQHRLSAVRFSAGDWDFGSDTLADEVAALSPGRYVGERRHIDEVTLTEGDDDSGTLVTIHPYVWDGSAWRPDDDAR